VPGRASLSQRDRQTGSPIYGQVIKGQRERARVERCQTVHPPIQSARRPRIDGNSQPLISGEAEVRARERAPARRLSLSLAVLFCSVLSAASHTHTHTHIHDISRKRHILGHTIADPTVPRLLTDPASALPYRVNLSPLTPLLAAARWESHQRSTATYVRQAAPRSVVHGPGVCAIADATL
jgi:hypothetical protein